MTLRKPRADAESHRSELRTVELFGGAGGLALGLHCAGFRLTALIENNSDACETLRANGTGRLRHTAGWPVHEASVVGFDYSELSRPDLLSAGAPCQPFSQAGHRLGRGDERNMFPAVVEAIATLQPRAFLVENVQGLLFARMRDYFDRLLRDLKHPSHSAGRLRRRRGRPKAEYHVSYKVLRAADYGAPQARDRLFIVGLPLEYKETWAWPTPTHSRSQLLVALHGAEYWERHGVPMAVARRVRQGLRPVGTPDTGAVAKRWHTVRDMLSTLGEPAGSAGEASDKAHVFVPGARLYTGHTGSVLDWPAKTVKAGVHGSPGGEHIVVMDDGSYRYFTVRECGLLQGFPPDYAFPALRSKAMRQIGNAVPVPVATAVGKQLAEVLTR